MATAAANGTGEADGVRLVLGTLDLPDTRLAPRLLDRYVDAGGRALDVANVYRRRRGVACGGPVARAGPGPPPGPVREGLPPAALPPGPRRGRGRHRAPAARRRPDRRLHPPPRRPRPYRSRNGRTRCSRRSRRGRSAASGCRTGRSSACGRCAPISTPPAPITCAPSATTSRSRGCSRRRGRGAWRCPLTTCARSATSASPSSRGRAWRPASSPAATRLTGTTPPTARAAIARRSSPSGWGRPLRPSPSPMSCTSPRHVRPVVGTRSAAHLDEALGAAAIRLGPEDVVWLESGEAG